MDTEYRAKFKPIGNGNVRRSFEDKVFRDSANLRGVLIEILFLFLVNYRRNRRQLEANHVPFYWENGVYTSRTPSPKNRRPPLPAPAFPQRYSDLKNCVNFKFDLFSPSDGQFMPKLDLDLLSPSPPPPRRKIQRSFSVTSDDQGHQMPRALQDTAVQTTLRATKPKCKDTSSQTPYRWKASIYDNKENEPFLKQLRASSRSRERRQRSHSPFAVYGLGDKERTTAGKRTFNVKADGGSQVVTTFRNSRYARS